MTPTAPRARAQQRDGAVDAAAHRDRDALRVGRRSHRRRERVRERVDRQRLAADRRRLEERQPAQVLREAVGVGVDDAVAVDAQPDRRPLRAACGIAEELHALRVEWCSEAADLPRPV